MRANEPDPQLELLLEELEAIETLPFHEHSVETARRTSQELRRQGDGPPLGDSYDRTIPGEDDPIPVRIYEPAGVTDPPAVVYFHGGGWVFGDLDSHDMICRHLAASADVFVMSVDYRLAPEHPFPAAVEDAYAATDWVANNRSTLGVEDRLAVAGDSAGANLAAVTSLLARDRGGPRIDHQALIYPTTTPSSHWSSLEENASGYFLERADVQWFYDHYFENALDREHPYAFPLNAAHHSNLPPATIITAGFDPLRDEGRAYADKLAEDGVPTTHINFDGMIHGFAGMLTDPLNLEQAHETIDIITADLDHSFGQLRQTQ